MGDYNVQIISARLKKPEGQTEAEFESEIRSRIPCHNSAYHATAPFVSIEHESYGTYVSAIVQAKYNRGVAELLNWMRPLVVQGMGEGEAWAINFSEYSRKPEICYLEPENSND